MHSRQAGVRACGDGRTAVPSYLFYFIVSRSHPQPWVNIFLRDRAPTHPSPATILSTVTTTPYSPLAVFRSRSSFPQHCHPSPPRHHPFDRSPGSVDIANERGVGADGGHVISKFEEEDCEKLPLGISYEAVGISRSNSCNSFRSCVKKIVSNYLSTGTGPPSVDIYCFSDYFANCINIRKFLYTFHLNTNRERNPSTFI